MAPLPVEEVQPVPVRVREVVTISLAPGGQDQSTARAEDAKTFRDESGFVGHMLRGLTGVDNVESIVRERERHRITTEEGYIGQAPGCREGLSSLNLLRGDGDACHLPSGEMTSDIPRCSPDAATNIEEFNTRNGKIRNRGPTKQTINKCVFSVLEILEVCLGASTTIQIDQKRISLPEPLSIGSRVPTQMNMLTPIIFQDTIRSPFIVLATDCVHIIERSARIVQPDIGDVCKA
jgi:hypothetical protein